MLYKGATGDERLDNLRRCVQLLKDARNVADKAGPSAEADALRAMIDAVMAEAKPKLAAIEPKPVVTPPPIRETGPAPPRKESKPVAKQTPSRNEDDPAKLFEDERVRLGVTAAIGLALVWVYFWPALVARRRGHSWFPFILALNVFFGWTIVGWILLFAAAHSGKHGTGR